MDLLALLAFAALAAACAGLI
ncbi:MAG: hypothetical protein RL071_3103, partial [Pseudomonadota bacterium]